jgi:hypothetical protein
VSCDYRWGRGHLSNQYSTITVPYAEGDPKGELTCAVIKELSKTGAFRYVSTDGDLILKIKMIESSDENIGFRYDRKKTGELRKILIPTETRKSSTIEFEIVETSTQKMIRGPIRLAASVDFDHDYYSSRNGVNIFSLGQLTDIDGAEDAAIRPLNRKLAEKIVDYTNNSW